MAAETWSNRIKFTGLGAAGFYFVMSIGMQFVNKYTVQVFPLTHIVLILQMVATIAIIQPLQACGLLAFPAFSPSKAWDLLPISVLYTGNIVFALTSLKYLNIPMYNVIKRNTPMLILVTKSLITGKWPPRDVTASVATVVGGCIIAGIGDLAFSMPGYLTAFASVLMQSGYLLVVEFRGAKGMPANELLYYNAITSLPLLVLMALGLGEVSELRTVASASVAAHGALAFGWAIALCSMGGMLLNYALFVSTTLNTALTTTIVGVLKGVVSMAAGYVFLNSHPPGALNVTGAAINTLGGTWYSWIKFNEKNQPGRGGRRDSGTDDSTRPLSKSKASGADLTLPVSAAAVAAAGAGAEPLAHRHQASGSS